MSIQQVIVYTHRPEFKMLLEIECKGLGGFSPIIHQDLDEFKSMLDLFEGLEILVIDEPLDLAVFKSIQNYLAKKRHQIKEVFFLAKSLVTVERARIFDVQHLEGLLVELKKMIHPAASDGESYISIPLESLVHFKDLPFELYIKIAGGKYIRRIPAHEEIDEKTFASFAQRGINELYYERRFIRDFSNLLINNMINKVEREYQSIDQKLSATSEVFQTTHQIVTRLGFKPRVIEVCESVLNQIMGDVSAGTDTFARFLEQLRSQQELSFNYRLMELTSFIASQILELAEPNEKEEKMRRLIFASMFCDYSLKQASHIHIRTPEQLKKLPLAEQKDVNEHAFVSSQLVASYAKAPLEAAALIKQHHGSPTGLGIPGEYSPKLLPLSRILVVAQEIAYQILSQSFRPPHEVLSDLKHLFVDTSLEEYYQAFARLCQKNLPPDVPKS